MDRVTEVLSEALRQALAASAEQRLYRSGKLETFLPSPDEHHRRINALLADSDGSIFGATEEGLVGLRDGVRTRLTSRNGLPCDFVYTMVKDDAGSLWLDTKCGIVEIPAAELAKWWAQPASLVNIKVLDGFDGAQPGETAVIERMRILRQQGMAVAIVAETLNAEGLRPRAGLRWYATSVYRVLKATSAL